MIFFVLFFLIRFGTLSEQIPVRKRLFVIQKTYRFKRLVNVEYYYFIVSIQQVNTGSTYAFSFSDEHSNRCFTHMHRNEQHNSPALLPHPDSYSFYFIFHFLLPPPSSSFPTTISSRGFLGRARFRFEAYELFGHLVVGPL